MAHKKQTMFWILEQKNGATMWKHKFKTKMAAEKKSKELLPHFKERGYGKVYIRRRKF